MNSHIEDPPNRFSQLDEFDREEEEIGFSKRDSDNRPGAVPGAAMARSQVGLEDTSRTFFVKNEGGTYTKGELFTSPPCLPHALSLGPTACSPVAASAGSLLAAVARQLPGRRV